MHIVVIIVIIVIIYYLNIINLIYIYLQVAFIGRTSVGKSSLINALLNQTKLVKTSKRPVCTCCILDAGLATEQEHHLAMGKYTERTERNFQCSVCRSVIG